jgi:hypothetical protein
MDIRTDMLSHRHNGALDHDSNNVVSPRDAAILSVLMGLPNTARPEDMFLIWYFSLPESANVAAAARIEVGRLDSIANACEKTTRLRALFVQASMPALPRQGRRRLRH